MTIKEARLRAADLIRKNRITTPPVDAEWIARFEKVSVLFVSLNAEVRDQVSAYVETDRAIYVNRDQPPEHKNYAIAHELGHLQLHPDYVESDRYQLLLRNTFVGAGKSKEEKEAEAFAAELLVPRKMLDMFRNREPESLVTLFVAPIEVIRAQLGPPVP